MSATSDSAPESRNVESQRADRWLWFARFLKSRTQAAALITSGKLRINSKRVDKSSHTVRPGDVLTFPLGNHVRVVKVLGPGIRRGPAPEARLLYEDLEPPGQAGSAASDVSAGPGPDRPKGEGRPTKKERRATDALKGAR